MQKYLLSGEISKISKSSSILDEKPVDVIVELLVSNLENLPAEEFISNQILLKNNNGYKTSGLLYFEIYRSTRNFSNLLLKENSNYQLKLFKNSSVTSFPIIILKKEHEIEVNDNNFRFYYSFHQINKCLQDDIFIFEKQFKFLEHIRLFSFHATRYDKEIRKGIVNTFNLNECTKIIQQKLKDLSFISSENEILNLQITEINFDDKNIILDN